MKFLATITALAAAAGLSSAVPAQQAESLDAIGPGGYKQYYLQAVALDDGSPSFNNFYVEAYHTGAGEADATLSAKKSFKGYLNETHGNFIFVFPAGHGKYYPYGLDLALLTEYTSFQPAQINTGYGTRGFYIENGMLQSKNKEFGGWRVCKWWHDNVPQLFHEYSFDPSSLTDNCANVNLVAVPA